MKKHMTSVRVRYEETDRMGVVYYANYLVWFEIARTEYFREMGLSYRNLEEKNQIRLMVVDARCTYKSPATYDDIVNIETVLVEMGNTSLVFGYSIHRDSTVIATGQTTHVFTDRNGKLIKMPPEIREKLSF